MSDSNDTLTSLLMFAFILHGLALLAMAAHTALLPATPGDEENRTVKALLLGRAPVQRVAFSRALSRLLAVSALLLAAACAVSLGRGAAAVGTTTLAVIALLQLASAYAWHQPRSGTGEGDAQATAEETAAEPGDLVDHNHEEVPREGGSD